MIKIYAAHYEVAKEYQIVILDAYSLLTQN
jgi:hypothetical protein